MMAGIQMFRMDVQRKTEGHISPEPIGKGEMNLLEPGCYVCALSPLWKFGPESHFQLGMETVFQDPLHIQVEQY